MSIYSQVRQVPPDDLDWWTPTWHHGSSGCSRSHFVICFSCAPHSDSATPVQMGKIHSPCLFWLGTYLPDSTRDKTIMIMWRYTTWFRSRCIRVESTCLSLDVSLPLHTRPVHHLPGLACPSQGQTPQPLSLLWKALQAQHHDQGGRRLVVTSAPLVVTGATLVVTSSKGVARRRDRVADAGTQHMGTVRGPCRSRSGRCKLDRKEYGVETNKNLDLERFGDVWGNQAT